MERSSVCGVGPGQQLQECSSASCSQSVAGSPVLLGLLAVPQRCQPCCGGQDGKRCQLRRGCRRCRSVLHSTFWNPCSMRARILRGSRSARLLGGSSTGGLQGSQMSVRPVAATSLAGAPLPPCSALSLLQNSFNLRAASQIPSIVRNPEFPPAKMLFPMLVLNRFIPRSSPGTLN